MSCPRHGADSVSQSRSDLLPCANSAPIGQTGHHDLQGAKQPLSRQPINFRNVKAEKTLRKLGPESQGRPGGWGNHSAGCSISLRAPNSTGEVMELFSNTRPRFGPMLASGSGGKDGAGKFAEWPGHVKCPHLRRGLKEKPPETERHFCPCRWLALSQHHLQFTAQGCTIAWPA